MPNDAVKNLLFTPVKNIGSLQKGTVYHFGASKPSGSTTWSFFIKDADETIILSKTGLNDIRSVLFALGDI